VLCLLTRDWAGLLSLPEGTLWGLGGLTLVALLSETLAVAVNSGTGHRTTASVTFLPILAAIQLFGQTGAVALAIVTLPFAEVFVRRKDALRATFNIAQVLVATTIAGTVFEVLGGEALQGPTTPDIANQLLPFVGAGLTVIAINHAAVSLALTLSQGLPFRRVWQRLLDNSGASLSDLLVSPVALAIAFLYVQFGLPGIVVVILPMLFIRYSYLNTARLRDANSDLLTALVKAIEVRDPYTSGHSVRVSGLARRIAEHMGLNRFLVDRIANAALLHDIGKVEAVYNDILRKPDALTAEERRIIESHVTKGEQLLRDLASVPDDVVKIVRHHHEREDGQGYPDGLKADEIPLGSKVIVVCDAVDAMLSDRPYRKALPLDAVREQLRLHTGSQFDHKVVTALVDSEILVEFAETMRVAREEQRAAERDATVHPLPTAPSMRAVGNRTIASRASQYH
jgi:putative nucleotidyltransferase with HDIG domain